MIAGIASFFGGLFSSSRMQDTAIDALRKVGGLDAATAQEQMDFVLKYVEATKHQSTVRRFIALLLTCLYSLLILCWVLFAGIGYLADYVVALEYAGAVKNFMVDTVVQPFNIILSFYFVMNIAGKLKG